MLINNSDVAKIFTQVADLLEIEGDNPFRVRAYRNAAQSIDNLPRDITELVKEKYDLTEISGIGEDLAKKMVTLVETGKLPLLQEIKKRVPVVLTELLKVESLGPKRVLKLYKKLKIRNIHDLSKAIEAGKIRNLPGFGEKTEQKIKESIKHVVTYMQRLKLVDATFIAEPLLAYLKTCKAVKDIVIAGSYRRGKETVGDLDLVATAKNSQAVIQHFINYTDVVEVLSQGTTRSTVRLKSGIQADLRVVPQASYGAALLYFTGSKSHNLTIRKMAIKKNLKVNEYGVFKNDHCIASKTEKEVYRKVGLPYIEPELRENQGEIEAALQGKLPRLVTLNDIRGDLHCHTLATDGKASLEIMAQTAAKLGHEYLAITDHSKHLSITHGLNEKELLKQIKIIDRLNETLSGITILKAIEVDILPNGSLDLSDAVLKELDLTVCSIHSNFALSAAKQTARILRAMDNRYFNILGHPTGKLIQRREPYQIDLECIMQAAKERNCFLELNAQPDRLDLNDIHCRMAKEMKLKLVISSDAHSADQLRRLQFGIYQARRGWLEENDVLNTFNLTELKKLLLRK